MGNPFCLKGRTAIVTGSTSGLGRAMAVALGEAGANIVVTGRSSSGGARTLEMALSTGASAVFIQGDLRKQEDIDHLIQKTQDTYGALDILINNAGINKPCPTLELTRETWMDIIETNLNSVVFMAQAAAKVMTEQHRGVIINTASISGMMVNYQVAQGSYYAAKAAIIMLTKAWAAEWASLGIRVNAIAPGYMKTEQTKKSFTDPACEEMVSCWMRATPMGRPGEPEELGGAAVYLASDAASYVTGHTMVVDGGTTVY